MIQKWRPPLLLVLGGSLLAVLVLPVLGLFVVDALAPRLGHARAVAAVALGAFSVTLVLGWLLWRLILAPVQALARRAAAIRGGEQPQPMTRFGTPEIGALGEAVMDMAEVLRARELAVRSYADHVTHELKTPLTAIRGAAELMATDPALDPQARALAGTIADAEARAEQLLAAARQIAAARVPEHHGSTTLAAAMPAAPEGLETRIDGADVTLPLSREGLGVVLTHLLANAADAGARIVRLTATGLPRLSLTISDDGPGISPGNRDRVFDPFFTTHRETGGTGMGLAIVHTMLLAHGAEITLERSDSGATFRVLF